MVLMLALLMVIMGRQVEVPVHHRNKSSGEFVTRGNPLQAHREVLNALARGVVNREGKGERIMNAQVGSGSEWRGR
jgi:hypothetical protein